MSDLEVRPHALYRFFGPGGTLLYIGITADLPARMKKHSDEKAWWLSITNVTIEHFPDRPSVLEAERRAIIAEKPLYNDQHNTVAPRTWDRGAPPAKQGPSFRVLCMGCGQDAPAGSSIHCSMKETHAVEAAYHAYRTTALPNEWGAIDMDVWLDLPSDAAWMVHCDDCNPHRDWETDTFCENESCYWFTVDRCRTWPDLIGWTTHLSEKKWLEYTDWMQFIGHIARTGVMGGATAPADRPMNSTAGRSPKFMRIVADALTG